MKLPFLPAAVVGLVLVLALAPPAPAQEQPVAVRVAEIFARMDQGQGEGVWNQAQHLERLGAPAAPEIARRLLTARGATRLAAAKALLVMEGAGDAERSAALNALKEAIRTETGRELRIRACDLLAAHGQRDAVRTLARDLDSIQDPLVKIALLKLLRLRGQYAPAERALREFLASEDFSVQSEAALALAEIGNVDVAEAILVRLKDEPTERGRRAAAFLEQDRLLDQLERFGGLESTDQVLQMRDRQIATLQAELERLRTQMRSGLPDGGGNAGAQLPGADMLQEIFQHIRSVYVDPERADAEALIDSAAQGMVDHLDPFSDYMSAAEVEEFNKNIRQQYGGIGAVVQIDRQSGYLTIQRPIYDNPAFRAGLRTLDRVVEVEGQSTHGRRVEELVEVLKGTPGTAVTIRVEPFLGGEPRVVQITRQQIMLPSARHDMLPGGIGYVQLAQFGTLATQEIEQALVDLERRGMRGLVLDLRGNPGGLLAAAVEIADKFLNDDQLVVYSEGRAGTRFGVRQEDGGPEVVARRRRQQRHPDYPLVVLVDEGAASASEIVAGALQAHGRAELVGMQTFGKGSVQQIFALQSTEERAALRMTIAHYFLPDGRCIHRPRDVETWRFMERMRMEIDRWEQDGRLNQAQARDLREQYQPASGGVEPDYRVELPELSAAKQRAYGTIFDLQLLEGYIRGHWVQHRDLFHRLADFDGFDAAQYPDFDALWSAVQEGLDQASREAITREDLRLLLRAMVRRFKQDDVARVLTSDFQEDHQLQAAIAVIMPRTGQQLGQVPELSFIAQEFPDGVARTRVAAGGAPNPPGGGGGNPPPGGRNF